MAVSVYTVLDRIRTAYSVSSLQTVKAAFGDKLNTWHEIVTGLTDTLEGLFNLTNGQMIIGVSGAAPNKAALSGDATMSTTGVLTIANLAVNTAKLANDAVTTAKILAANVTPSKMSENARINFAFAGYDILDLGGGSGVQDGLFVLYTDRAITIKKIFYVYFTASGAVAGPYVPLRLGTYADNDAYWSGFSEPNKAQGTATVVSSGFVTASVPANTAIVAGCGAGLTDGGQVYAGIAYTVDD